MVKVRNPLSAICRFFRFCSTGCGVNKYCGFLSKYELKRGDFTPKRINYEKPTLLYFSAGWCRSCRYVTPQLKRFCEKIDNKVNVVWVSRDRSLEDQMENFEKMGPWHYLEYGNPDIGLFLERYRIKTIPAIILVNREGDVVADDIREQIAKCETVEHAKEIAKYWKLSSDSLIVY